MSSEKVSVIIPLYNARPYIEQTINSILAQAFQDFKLYIIDDWSTDGSADVAKDFAEKFPEKVIYRRLDEKAGRPSIGKNVGIKMSHGRYIAFMDHDDWWEPDHLELLVRAIEKDPKIGLVGANAVIYDDKNSKNLARFREHPENLDTLNLAKETLLNPPYLTSSCMLFRREALDKIGPMDDSLFMSDDHEIAIRMVLDRRYKLVALPKVTIYRRWLSSSLSNNVNSIERALSDSSYIYEKLRNYRGITKEEQDLLDVWYQTVRRRWANYLLAVGQVHKAKEIYGTLKNQGRQALPVTLIRIMLNLSPYLAQKIVAAKKSWGFQHPETF